MFPMKLKICGENMKKIKNIFEMKHPFEMGDILYFHGASNDKGQDADNKKIEPPSPEHPFFVSKNPSVAVEYSDFQTGADGRIIETIVDKNSRVYILRLNENKINAFDFSNRSDMEKLSKFYGRDWRKFYILLMAENSWMDVTSSLAHKMNSVSKEYSDCTKILIEADKILGDKIYDVLLKTGPSEEQIEEIERNRDDATPYTRLILRFLPYLYEIGKIDKQFIDMHLSNTKFISWKLSRRDLKAILFRQIASFGYNCILERNTIEKNDAKFKLNDFNDTNREFAIMDINVIRDIYPYPVKIDTIIRIIELYFYTRKNKKEYESDFTDYLIDKLSKLD